MKRKLITMAVGGFLAAASLQAQTTNSGYFVDGYTYRYSLNPAFGSDKGFVSFPGLGNLNVAARGNLHLSSVIYTSTARPPCSPTPTSAPPR